MNFEFSEDSASDEELQQTAKALQIVDNQQQGQHGSEQTESNDEELLISEEEVRMYLDSLFQIGAAISGREHWFASETELNFVVPKLTRDLNRNPAFRKLVRKSDSSSGYGFLGYMIIKRVLLDYQAKKYEEGQTVDAEYTTKE